MKYRHGKGWAAMVDKNVIYLLEDSPDVWITVDRPNSLKARWKRAVGNPWFWVAWLVVVVGFLFAY